MASPGDWQCRSATQIQVPSEGYWYRGIPPKHLYTPPKHHIYPPLAKWIRCECKPLMEHMLDNKRMQSLFNMQHVRCILDDHVSHKHYGLHTVEPDATEQLV